MEKQTYKILPNGSPSGLSLNQFQVYRSGKTKWNGLCGQEIYSLKSFQEKILLAYPQYCSSQDFDILKFVQQNYDTETKIQDVIEETVDGLANMVISLYEGNTECINHNCNLFDSDWEFWRKCQYVVLDGRLISGCLGEKIISMLTLKLRENNVSIKILKLSDFVDVSTASLLGCASGYKEKFDKQYVFDFGNTAVKRGRAKWENEKIFVDELTPIHHEDFWQLPDNMQTSAYVDDFISNLIIKTITEFNGISESVFNIGMCLANNIIDNKISNRGSYRFLRLIGEDYQEHLSAKLSVKFGTPVHLYIYNDAEAVGRIFSSFSPNTAIITLGTFMGIAYTPKE